MGKREGKLRIMRPWQVLVSAHPAAKGGRRRSLQQRLRLCGQRVPAAEPPAVRSGLRRVQRRPVVGGAAQRRHIADAGRRRPCRQAEARRPRLASSQPEGRILKSRQDSHSECRPDLTPGLLPSDHAPRLRGRAYEALGTLPCQLSGMSLFVTSQPCMNDSLWHHAACMVASPEEGFHRLMQTRGNVQCFNSQRWLS